MITSLKCNGYYLDFHYVTPEVYKSQDY